MKAEKGFVIAVDGAAGSGKSSLANNIAEMCGLPPTQVIHSDYYFEPSETQGVNAVLGTPGGFNAKRFMDEVGSAVNNPNEQLTVIEYDWATKEYKAPVLPDREQLIVVEGIKLIGLPVQWGLSLWVDTPRDMRLKRFLDRRLEDRRMKELNRDVLLSRFNLWADDAERYEEELGPLARDDIHIIRGDISPEEQLDMINRLLEEARSGAHRPSGTLTP